MRLFWERECTARKNQINMFNQRKFESKEVKLKRNSAGYLWWMLKTFQIELYLADHIIAFTSKRLFVPFSHKMYKRRQFNGIYTHTSILAIQFTAWFTYLKNMSPEGTIRTINFQQRTLKFCSPSIHSTLLHNRHIFLFQKNLRV